MLPAVPTVPSVGAAGLMGPEDAHCRGALNSSCPSVKIFQESGVVNGSWDFFRSRALRYILWFKNTHDDTDAENFIFKYKRVQGDYNNDRYIYRYSPLQQSTRWHEPDTKSRSFNRKQTTLTNCADIGIYCLACTKTSLNNCIKRLLEVINRIQ